MNRRPKQPVETLRAWAPWALLGLALAEVGLSIFQWFELRRVQAGGTAVCSVNANINCGSDNNLRSDSSAAALPSM